MTDIATRGTTSALAPTAAIEPLTGKQLEARLAGIHDLIKTVMKKDVDYGVIPGTQKPTLYKPGAEKLVVAFRLAAGDPNIVEVIDQRDVEIRYRVRVPILTQSGQVLAVGVGECSSLEEKYKWRRPVHQNEYEAAAVDRKREKFQKDGKVWKQVRVEPADVGNTILKMAHKRAYIHAAIMATAASSVFAQDLEDLPEGMAEDTEDGTERRQPPQSRSAEPSQSAGAGEATISDPQDKRLFAICRDARVEMVDLKAWLAQHYAYTSQDGAVRTERIRKADYDAIVDAAKRGLRG